MATIDFKCDTCKREITLAENPLGMTVFAKCVINFINLAEMKTFHGK